MPITETAQVLRMGDLSRGYQSDTSSKQNLKHEELKNHRNSHLKNQNSQQTAGLDSSTFGLQVCYFQNLRRIEAVSSSKEVDMPVLQSNVFEIESKFSGLKGSSTLTKNLPKPCTQSSLLTPPSLQSLCKTICSTMETLKTRNDFKDLCATSVIKLNGAAINSGNACQLLDLGSQTDDGQVNFELSDVKQTDYELIQTTQTRVENFTETTAGQEFSDLRIPGAQKVSDSKCISSCGLQYSKQEDVRFNEQVIPSKQCISTNQLPETVAANLLMDDKFVDLKCAEGQKVGGSKNNAVAWNNLNIDKDMNINSENDMAVAANDVFKNAYFISLMYSKEQGVIGNKTDNGSYEMRCNNLQFAHNDLKKEKKLSNVQCFNSKNLEKTGEQITLEDNFTDPTCSMANMMMENPEGIEGWHLQHNKIHLDHQDINFNSEKLIETITVGDYKQNEMLVLASDGKIMDDTKNSFASCIAQRINTENKLNVGSKLMKSSETQNSSQNTTNSTALGVLVKDEFSSARCGAVQKLEARKSNSLPSVLCNEKNHVEHGSTKKPEALFHQCSSFNSLEDINSAGALKRSGSIGVKKLKILAVQNIVSHHLKSDTSESPSQEYVQQHQSDLVNDVCRIFQNLCLKFNSGEQELYAKDRMRYNDKRRDYNNTTHRMTVSNKIGKSYNVEPETYANANCGIQDIYLRYYTDNSWYQCRVCHLNLASWFELHDHQRIHNLVWPYKCKLCSGAFRRYRLFQMHKEVHNPNYKHKWHMRYRPTKKPMTCDHCGALFLNKVGLTFHKIIHGSDTPRNCLLCPSTFHLQGALRNHMVHVHNKIKEFVCQQCGMKFRSRMQFAYHEYMHLICICSLYQR